MSNIELGSTVRDMITGFEGVAICRTSWLTGCDRVTVQPQELHEGKPVDSSTFDEGQLRVVKRGKPSDWSDPVVDPGGPRPEPRRR